MQIEQTPHFPVLLGLSPDVDPRAAVGDKGYAIKANRQAARSRGIIRIIPHKTNKEDKPTFFPKPSIEARQHRTGRPKAQALQALRPTLRKDQTKLRGHRRTRSRIGSHRLDPSI